MRLSAELTQRFAPTAKYHAGRSDIAGYPRREQHYLRPVSP
jgi:hypothetical protein